MNPYDQVLTDQLLSVCVAVVATNVAWFAYDWLTTRLAARRKVRAQMAAKWKGVCQ